ncbi:MAG: Gfo/Idh/MocA family oxidoreductase [Pirellulales bacterium]|nr:Gfo/Idh/MocA family oxidoreductase [Pirellulales bacterium]
MRKLRVAVVGAGRLGGFHAQKLADAADVELVAVVDPLPAARNRVAAKCRTQPLGDHRPLLGGIDAAVIASPTAFHHRLALEFLLRDIHVLVEKPICSTQAEADQLVAAARRGGLVLQVGHVERFNPAFTAAAVHTAGAKYIEAVRASSFTFRSTDVGVVLDLMIHDIDLVLSLAASPVRRVEALGLSVLGGHEDVANARIEFECGCVAALSASRVSHLPARRMQIWSPRAFAHVDFGARTTTLVRPSETLLRRQFDVNGLTPEQVAYLRDHLAEEHLPREELEFEAVDALALEVRDFIDSIRTPRAARVSGEAGRDALAVAEQILEKIDAHAWDETANGPVGPLAVPRPRVISAPHLDVDSIQSPLARREAG